MKKSEWGGEFEPSEASAGVIGVYNKSIIAFIEDERLLRRKYNYSNSWGRTWCQDRAQELGISADECTILDSQGLTINELNELNTELAIDGVVRGHYIAKKYQIHHLKHAWNGYAQSGFTDASILVMDGCDYPRGTSIAIYSAVDEKIELVKSYSTEYSLGSFYANGCVNCGFKWFQAGKLMGATSYTIYDDSFVPFFLVDPFTGIITEQNGRMLYDEQYKFEAPSVELDFNDSLNQIIQNCKPDQNDPSGFDFRYIKLAALIQKLFETSVFSLLDFMYNSLPSKNLIISGGCGLNCVLNGKIIRSNKWNNFFVPTTCDDAGNAIGAAILRCGVKLQEPLIYNKHTYGVPVEFNKEISDIDLAQYILNGQIIAWFEGGSEYGPRALCHRSIIANPQLSYIKYRINEIKNREYWRPLAPVILDSYFPLIFEANRIWEPHKVMLATEYIKKEWREKLPGVCAADGSSRPQVLTNNKYNSVLYNLMSNYNLPILINTSMNGRGEPICETPGDAINFCSNYSDILLVFVYRGKIYIRGN